MSRTALPYCHCQKKVKLTTSWTDKNPGRRFESCINHGKPSSCNHFAWFDEEMCPRSKVVIPGLLRKLNEKNAFINELQEKNARLSRHNDKLVGKVLKVEGSDFDYAEIASNLPLPDTDDEEVDSVHLEPENVENNGYVKVLEDEVSRLKVRGAVLSVVVAFGVLLYVWHLMGFV